MQWMSKCSKKCDACAELLFLLIKPTIYYCFLMVFLSPLWLLKLPNSLIIVLRKKQQRIDALACFL